MARFPASQWRPLADDWAKQPKIGHHDLIILHTMVGSLKGTDGMFRADGYGGVESHFGVGADGTVYQWQDTAYKAEANGAANARAISIETEDINTAVWPKWNTNDGAAVPAWTDEQVEAIAHLCSWASTVHGIPLTPVMSSLRSERGVAYHRLGVPGKKGATQSVTGGELWSSATGKVCPGPRRTAQIPGIIQRALQIRAGSSATAVARQDPAAPLTPVPEEAMLSRIPLIVAGDGTFRSTEMVETHSALAGDAYLLLGSTWGASQFDITALAANGTPIYQWHPVVQNNNQWNLQLPPDTRILTIEGAVQNHPTSTDRGTGPAAALGFTAPR